jgi:ABC-type transporter Mla subunit MlaD
VGALGLVLALTIGGSRDSGHKVFVVLPEASTMIPGQQIRESGRPVGSVDSIAPMDKGQAARVGLRLDDEVWPLQRGTTFELRWGGTVSFSNRYVALRRGSGPPLPDGATLATAQFTTPIEFDAVTRLFTPRLRRDVTRLLNVGGRTFPAVRDPLRASIHRAPRAVQQAGRVFRALQDNQRALDTLLKSTAGVSRAVYTANPGVGPLLSGAGTTFHAAADEARNLQVTIDRLTPALTQSRTTLKHADRTLTNAGTLVHRLSPGVVELRRLARPLSDLLTSVVEVGGDARATVAALHRATPALNPLLAKATNLMPTIGSIGHQAVTELRCIRPYTPDIVSIFSNWGDFFAYHDDKDKMARVIVDNIPAAGLNAMPYDSATATKLFPGLQYAFPRPPGLAAGQPWFLPECGAGREALDPSQDPEAKR